jgi:hypothetical protein
LRPLTRALPESASSLIRSHDLTDPCAESIHFVPRTKITDNAISELPAELGGLVGVREILLDANDVTSVPAAVFLSCESLQTLSLHGNPINEDMLVDVDGCVRGAGKECSRVELCACVQVRERVCVCV